jgi:hypothetical protein
MEPSTTHILVSIAPFLLLLALWFFLLKRMQAAKRTTSENPFGPPQQMTTSEIVAELRSLRQSIDALREGIKARDQER